MSLVDLPKSTGAKNQTGFASKMLMIKADEIDSYPGPPDPLVLPGDSLLMDGPITVKDPLTQGFAECYITAKTAKFIMELAGQKDSKNFDETFEFFRPGIDLPLIEQMIADHDYVCVIQPPDCTSTLRYVIGQPCNPAELKGSYDSGQMGEKDGKNGWTAMMSYYGPDIRVIDVADNPIPMLP